MSKTTQIDTKMQFVCKEHLKKAVMQDISGGVYVAPIKRPDAFGAMECHFCSNENSRKLADFIIVKIKGL